MIDRNCLTVKRLRRPAERCPRHRHPSSPPATPLGFRNSGGMPTIFVGIFPLYEATCLAAVLASAQNSTVALDPTGTIDDGIKRQRFSPFESSTSLPSGRRQTACAIA